MRLFCGIMKKTGMRNLAIHKNHLKKSRSRLSKSHYLTSLMLNSFKLVPNKVTYHQQKKFQCTVLSTQEFKEGDIQKDKGRIFGRYWRTFGESRTKNQREKKGVGKLDLTKKFTTGSPTLLMGKCMTHYRVSEVKWKPIFSAWLQNFNVMALHILMSYRGVDRCSTWLLK